MADRPQDAFQISPDPGASTLGGATLSPAYTGAPSSFGGREVCGLCGQQIGGDYFRVNGRMACAACAFGARNGASIDSHAAFSRGVLLGAGAAVVGLIVYAAFTILTGWYIGYLALGVGWLVAKAIKAGSQGRGGRRYQIAAVLLTYAAISLSAIPVGISYVVKDHKAETKLLAAHGQGGESVKSPVPWGQIAGQLVMVGLASPFMDMRDPVHGLLRLFILFIGLRVAWRLTAGKPVDVEGPFPPLASAG